MNLDINIHDLREVLKESFSNDPMYDFTIKSENDSYINNFYLQLINEFPNCDIIEEFKKSIKEYAIKNPTKLGIKYTWFELSENSTFKYIARNVIDRLKVQKSRLLERISESSVLNTEFKKLHKDPISKDLAYSRALNLNVDADLLEMHNNNKVALVYKAYTGAGKSLGLDKWICESDPTSQKGIILCNDNFEAEEHMLRIKSWNPDMAKRCFVFNTEENNYKAYIEAKNNTNIFKKYNWVLCYQGRLLESNVDVLTRSLKDLDAIRSVGLQIANPTKTYIFSDECITQSPITRVSIYAIKKIDDITDNLLYKFTHDTKNVIYENELWKFFNALIVRLYNNNLTKDDKEILSVFAGKDITNSAEFQLSVYIARYSTFMKYIKNRSEDYLRQYNHLLDPTIPSYNKRDYIEFFPRVDEVMTDPTHSAIQHNLIIFDATASVDYSFDNSYFYIKTIAEQPKNNFDFHWLSQSFFKKNELTKEQVDKYYDNLDIKFKDYSIIITTKNPWSTNNELYKKLSPVEQQIGYNVIKLKEYLSKTLGNNHHCHVAYFQGADLIGRNIFNNCKNVYILGEYYLRDEALRSMKSATMNDKLTNAHFWTREVIQGSGRGEGRNYNISIDENLPGIMNYYFTSDIDTSLVFGLIEYYGLKSARLKFDNEFNFDKWVDLFCDSIIKGPKVITTKFRCENPNYNLIETRGQGYKTIEKFKYLANRWYKGIKRININELVDEGLISKPEISRVSGIKDLLCKFGINDLVVFSRRSEW